MSRKKGKLHIKAVFIYENTEELNNSKRWMGIIKLDCDLVGEIVPGIVLLLVSSDNVTQRRSNPEVLLFQSEFFTFRCVIIRIQHTGDSLSLFTLGNGIEVIGLIESIEVEFINWHRSEESEVDSMLLSETWNWDIISLGFDVVVWFPRCDFVSTVVVLLGVATETDFVLDINSFNFKWVTMSEPIIWRFNLSSVDDLLFENTVMVSDTITPTWIVKSGN